MTQTIALLNTPDITTDDYCVFGLATCFIKEEGEYHQVEILEPIPSAALEVILNGIPTSYKLACAKTLREIFSSETPQIPAEFSNQTQFCDNFNERTIAAVRTYKSHPQAKNHIPLNTVKQNFNFSLERKRILNATNVIRTEDNVKQHTHTHSTF
jgi:hypothetical protein